MEIISKCSCVICGKETTNNNSYIGSHTKRKHGLLIYDYVEKYYKSLTPNFKKETCGFCDRLAIPNYIIDHINHTYSCDYNDGYLCRTDECKNNIALEIFKKPYIEVKKQYEYIGSKTEYLSKLYKKTIKDICSTIKHNPDFKFKPEQTTSLLGYTSRYGEIDGLKKYKERCDKISKSQTKQYYLDKFGIIEGEIKWNNYINKIKKNTLGTNISKESGVIKKYLEELNINFYQEYLLMNVSVIRKCDYYLPEYNTIIEWFGDYWHANPTLFKKDQLHNILKVTCGEIWEKDKKRIETIKENFNNSINVIIIWGSSKITKEYLHKLLHNIKDKNTTIWI